MISDNISLTDVDSLNNLSEVVSNKETQTNTAYVTDSFILIKGPSHPLPKSINHSELEVKIIDCKIIKDPSDSKTDNSETGSFTKAVQISNVSISEDSNSPRLTYCKEVIVPYLNSHVLDCEDNHESFEKIIQEVLEELPNLQPYPEKEFQEEGIHDNTQDISLISHNIFENKMSTQLDEDRKKDPSKTELQSNQKRVKDVPLISNINQVSSSSSSKTSKTTVKKNQKDPNVQLTDKDDGTNENPEIHKTLSKKNSKSIKNNVLDVDNKVEKNTDISKKISKEFVVKCAKNSITTLKQSASVCLDKIGNAIQVKKPAETETPTPTNENPTIKSEKLRFSSGTTITTEEKKRGNKNAVKNLDNTKGQSSTKTKSVKNVTDKLHNISKDEVTLKKSESDNPLNKNNPKEKNTASSSENQPNLKEPKLLNAYANSLANFLFKKTGNKSVEEEAAKEHPTHQLKNIDSVNLRMKLNELKEDIVNSKFNKSSPYDTPVSKEEPRESKMPTVSAMQIPEQAPTSSMFTTIKTKLFSIFCDEKEKTESVEEKNQQEHDECPLDRFMKH